MSRQVETLRLRGGERLVLAGQDFAGDRDDGVSVMIVQKICERLLARQKLCMAAVHLALSAGERQADLRDAREARVLRCTLRHHWPGRCDTSRLFSLQMNSRSSAPGSRWT